MMVEDKIIKKIKRGKIILVVSFFLATLFLGQKALAFNEKNQALSKGPFSLAEYWNGAAGSGSEIENASVEYKLSIAEENLTVSAGQSLNFSNISGNLSFKVGGGIFEDRIASGKWSDSLSQSDCSGNGIEYNIGSDVYQFDFCVKNPDISLSSSNSSIVSCSGMSCTALDAGTVTITASIGANPFKIWKYHNGYSWDSINESFSETQITWEVTVIPPPRITFSAASTNIAYNTATTLSWNATNATSCTASGDWSGIKELSGTQSTGNLYGAKNYILTCSGTGGSTSKSVSIIVEAPNPAPVLNFGADSLEINQGDSTNLNWSSSNASECIASGGWSGSKDLSGTFNTGSLENNATYTLTCSGPGGSISRNLTITVLSPTLPIPTLSFSSAKTLVTSGTSTTLSWQATDATSCTASDDWNGIKELSGTQSTGNLTSDKTYTLTCIGDGGSVSKKVEIFVVNPPTLEFSAASTNIAYNTATTLSWNATNATSCRAGWNWSGDKELSGTNVSTGNLIKTSNFTLTCSNATGSISKTVRVTVGDPPELPTLSFTADSYSLVFNAQTIFRWTATNATSCTASGDWSGIKAISGYSYTGSLLSNKTYILTCSSPNGSISSSISIVVGAAPTYNNPPTLIFTADSYQVPIGGTTRLRWTPRDATYCTASGDWSGVKGVGNWSHSESSGVLNNTKTFNLTCGNNVGSVTASVAIEVPRIALNFYADSTAVVYNTSTTLRWTATNATVCTALGDWSGTKSTSGSEKTANIVANKFYTLACSNSEETATVTVSISAGDPQSEGPMMSFWADKFLVSSGGSTTVRWKAQNATSCTASGDWSGVKGLSGSQSTGAISSNKKYLLTCRNNAGSSTMEVNIKVGTASSNVGLSFWADNINVSSGGSTILHWTSENMTSCTASGDWNGIKDLSGSQSTGVINQIKTYNLTCNGPSGRIEAIVKISVGAEFAAYPSVFVTADNYTLLPNSSTTIRWTSVNSDYCTLSLNGGVGEIIGLNGFRMVDIVTNSSVYTIFCSGQGGSISVPITINPAMLIVCPNNVFVQLGNTMKLHAYFRKGSGFDCGGIPADAVDVTDLEETQWISVDSSIATVDKGLISAINQGITNINVAYTDSSSSAHVEAGINIYISPPLVDCYSCDKTIFDCPEPPETKSACDDSQYTDIESCRNDCRNRTWKEVAPE